MIIACGVDVIEIARLERALERRGERLLRRVFTELEIEDCARGHRRFEKLALRFAAKEAAMKAVGSGWARGVAWRDIESRRRPAASGHPHAGMLELELGGRAAALSRELGARRAHLAVCRSRTHAIALVVLEGHGR